MELATRLAYITTRLASKCLVAQIRCLNVVQMYYTNFKHRFEVASYGSQPATQRSGLHLLHQPSNTYTHIRKAG